MGRGEGGFESEISSLITVRQLPMQLFLGSLPEAAKIESIEMFSRRAGLGKPSGGIWTSSLQPDGLSQWARFADDISHRSKKEHIWHLEPLPCRVATVSDVSDYEELLSSYRYRGEMSNYLPEDIFPMIDWSALSRDCEAVWLSNGRKTLPIASSFQGWDVESTLWFSWQFSSVHPAPSQR